jgi:gamma-glutamyltranspeptidase/glutathione hydrolase
MRGLTGAVVAAMFACAGSSAFAPPAAVAAIPSHSTSRGLAYGAVAASDAFGAAAAREILAKGGNAVDAAVATGFAEAVTYPEAGNIGGGGFMTVFFAGKPYFLDYRETAPAAARADMYLSADGNVIPNLSLVGNLAAGVPGTVRGLWAAHRRFGRLSWATDLEPAIRLASRGFVPSAAMVAVRDRNLRAFLGQTNFATYFGSFRAGVQFRQPELAATLRRIAVGGDKGFYEGRTAELIVAQMGRGAVRGSITEADLRNYQAVWREPIRTNWRGFDVITAPPPSSGGVALVQLLELKHDAATLFEGVALNSPQYIHLVAEMEKRVFADRAEYLGDPAFVSNPVNALTAPAYLARRASEIDPAKPSATAGVQPGLEKPQTTHFSIVDKWGDAVSNTYTLNGDYGAGVVVAGGGFLLNDEMDDFSAKPGAPNQFGVVGGRANAVAPMKRPLSSMTPTILVKDGEVALVIGTPGGSRIFTSVFQVIADIYDFGLPLPEALVAPRFHHQLLPENTIFTEPYAPFDAALIQSLGKRGYRVEDQGYNGDIEAIQIVAHRPEPASDPRQRGVSMVVR